MNGNGHRLTTPLDDSDVARLHAGDRVLVCGVLYVARDAAHRRLVEAIAAGERLPFDLEGQVIYYMGPSPARPGRPIGAAGPTTACRMDPYTIPLLRAGLRGMIGKGERGERVRQALCEFRAVYLAATGGAGALLAQCVRRAEVIAYPELGPEAVRRLEVVDLPTIVAHDIYGGNVYSSVGDVLYGVV